MTNTKSLKDKNIKVVVHRYVTNTDVEMTLVRVTETMLILEDASGFQVRLNRATGTDGLPVRKRCYSLSNANLEMLISQI